MHVSNECVCPTGQFMFHKLCKPCSYKCLTCRDTE
jgi:hypothetical protein